MYKPVLIMVNRSTAVPFRDVQFPKKINNRKIPARLATIPEWANRWVHTLR
jgi:hypothetical protein